MDTETLKLIIPFIDDVLVHIFNACIAQGFFPDGMKIARVTPVFKKGPSADPASYRPISVLPAISKIFEAMIAKRIVTFFEENEYLSEDQYGFRAGRGTQMAINSLLKWFLDTLEVQIIRLHVPPIIFPKDGVLWLPWGLA